MSEIRLRELDIRTSVVATPSPEDLALLASPDFAGPGVTAEDVHVREMLLAHNHYDRTFERFRKAHLDRFAETIRGKSMLPNHDSGGMCGGGSLPLGRFFKARTQERTEDFPILVRQREASADEKSMGVKAADVVPGFEPQPTRVTYLRPGFYFINDPTTESLRRNIDLGVYRHVSIGFRYDDIDCDLCRASYLKSDCPHILGRWDEGQLATGTYSGEPRLYEALEGSIVYLGAQPNARLIKSMVRDGTVDPERLAETPFGADLVRLKYAESLAREFGHQRKAWAFPKLSASDGADPSPNGGTADPAADAASRKDSSMDILKRLQAALGLPDTATEEETETAAKAAHDTATQAGTLKALQAVLLASLRTADEKAADQCGADALKAATALAALADVGAKALADLQEAILADDLRLTGKSDAGELEEILTLQAERRNYARLKGLYCAKREEVLKRFPAGISGDPDAGKQEEPRRQRQQDYQLA